MIDVKQIIATIKTILQSQIDTSKVEAQEYLKDLETRVTHLTQGNALGELSFKEVGERLADEKQNAEAFLIAMTGPLQIGGISIINTIISFLLSSLFQIATGKLLGV